MPVKAVGEHSNISNASKRGAKTKDYPAILSPSTLDIAFAAGFYEGEGHYSLRFNYYPLACIRQNDREILDWMRVRFGGVVGGPYVNPDTGNLNYEWRIVRERALGFMYTIFIFLSRQRRDQFSKAGTVESKRLYQKWISNTGISLNIVHKALIKNDKTQMKQSKKSKGMEIFGVKK